MLGYRDILSAEIIQDGYSVTKTSRTSQAGAARLGGVLFGGVGAVVGALTGTKSHRGKVTRIDLQIVVNDPHDPVFLVNFQNTKASANGIVTRLAQEQSREWLARVNVLIRLADEADEEPRMALTIFSVADELSKLVALKDRGVLSEIEFNTQRQKLLTGPGR
jgi:hypothetical protein